MRAFLEGIYYITTQGESIEISDLVAEINIYQNLFRHYMQCDIVMVDAVDLSNATKQDLLNNINGGFSGGELIVFQYKSEENPSVAHCFALYERKNRGLAGTGREAYVLSGISLEGFEAYPRKISKAYGHPEGNTIDKMIASIVDEYVYTAAVKDTYSTIRQKHNILPEKYVIAEPTSGSQRFVIPNMAVDDTIDFLCNEADSDDHIARYLFWERQEGFYFYNLSTLVEQTPVMDYYYTDFNTDVVDRDQRKIVGYDIKKETNFLSNARDGLYASKTIHLDVHKKTTNQTIFSYDDVREKSKFKTLQPFYHSGTVNAPEVNLTLMTTRKGHDACQCPLFEKENHLPKRLNDIIQYRKSYSKHLFNTVMNVTVPGTTYINAGDCVILKFPIKQLSTTPEGDNIQLSGKYIVTKVRNTIKMPKAGAMFLTQMECVKDTQIMGE